jgi:UDP-N-acetylglucosamine diphosphorylase/glucosamine-1-phosphate N-acetyltransferase
MDEMKNNNMNTKLATIILAAGKGTRMRSGLAKVLHPLDGKPMVVYPIELGRAVGSEIIAVIVGHQADKIKESITGDDIVFVHQEQQLGTGHAVLQCRDALQMFQGHILILCGDVPLLLPATIEALRAEHVSHQAAVTVLTTLFDDPTGYGRIVKDESDTILKIVEERDATDDERKIKEINSGIYCVDSEFLFYAVGRITNDNAQGEYYLTDILEIASGMKYTAKSFVIEDPIEVMGINTIEDLARADQIMKIRNGEFGSR